MTVRTSLRRPRPHEGDDRGAIAVWFALMVVVLIGSGALIIDMGALYRERRELQNGADAAALAVAIDCAATKCTGVDAMALKYAQLNASDGAVTIDLICGKGPGLTACKNPPAEAANVPYYVKVTTSTNNPASNPSSPSKVRFILGPLLNKTSVGSTVHASSVVAWGPLGLSNILPLTVSYCSFIQSGGTIGADGSVTFPATVVKVVFYDPSKSSASQSTGSCTGPGGQTTPGGFTWLGGAVNCSTKMDLTGGAITVDGDPGKSAEKGCKDLFTTLATPGNTTDYVLPLFDSASYTGTNTKYHVTGLVGFDLCSWNGIPSVGGNASTECKNACTGAQNIGQLCGYFSEAVISDGEWGSKDFGTRLIKVIG